MITLGGVLAVGAHGTGVPFVGETIPSGQALGTISNLVISFKAVVWDASSSAYILKTFQRSDVEAKALLINFGRTFITEVTLMVGPNYNLRCKSTTDISKNVLFSLVPGPNTFASYVNLTGRVETITFPFTDNPWLKVWSIEPNKPLLSREVDQPFNYIFSDIVPEEVSTLINLITQGSWFLAPVLGALQLSLVSAGLIATLTKDIWGPSKNTLLYIKPTTIRLTANGYAVLTNRLNVQKVVSTFVTYFEDLVVYYQNRGMYPFNGPMEIRATTLDKPGVVTNGEPPSFSAIHTLNDHPDYDIVIWFDVLCVPFTEYLEEAMNLLEQFILDEFNGVYASVRPEWAKGWAYTNESTWTDTDFIRKFIPSTFPSTTATDGWNWAVATLDAYDPHRIFTNSFIDDLLQTV